MLIHHFFPRPPPPPTLWALEAGEAWLKAHKGGGGAARARVLFHPGLELSCRILGAARAGRQEQWAAGGRGVLGSGAGWSQL